MARVPEIFGRVGDADLRSLLRTAPLPEGSLLEFKHKVLRNASGKVISPDQDRLHLSKADALRCRRVWGIATSLRKEKTSHNTVTPASAQVALRLNFLDRGDSVYRSFFVRTTAYAAAYSPRYPRGSPCTLSVGDMVSGTLERPASDRNSTAFASWDFARLDEFPATISNFGSIL